MAIRGQAGDDDARFVRLLAAAHGRVHRNDDPAKLRRKRRHTTCLDDLAGPQRARHIFQQFGM